MYLKVAICDDEEKQRIYMRSMLEAWAKERAHLTEVQTFSSAEAFLFAYNEDMSFDILLADIEMGKMNGVELARVLRARNERLQIVFVTGYDKYIADGYDVMALHYLMKPVNEEKLFLCAIMKAEQRKAGTTMRKQKDKKPKPRYSFLC